MSAQLIMASIQQPNVEVVAGNKANAASSKVNTKTGSGTGQQTGKKFDDVLSEATEKVSAEPDSVSDTGTESLTGMAALNNVAAMLMIRSTQVSEAGQVVENNVEFPLTEVSGNEAGLINKTLESNNAQAFTKLLENMETKNEGLLEQVNTTSIADATLLNYTLTAQKNASLTGNLLQNVKVNTPPVVPTAENMQQITTLMAAQTGQQKAMPEQVGTTVVQTNVANNMLQAKSADIKKITAENLQADTDEDLSNAILTTVETKPKELHNATLKTAIADITKVSTQTTTAQQQIPVEIESKDAHASNTNQFGQFVTLVNQNLQNSANTVSTQQATTMQQPLAEYDIPGQIVEQARLIKGTEDTEMVIKLRPEHLGELTMKVTVNNGGVSATFHSDNAQVRGLIETSILQLKQDLENQGLKVNNVGVYGGLGEFFSDGQNNRSGQEQNNRFKNRKFNIDDLEDEVDKVNGISQIMTEDAVDYKI